MRHFALIIFSILIFITVSGQTSANLKIINKTPLSANDDQQEITRLQIILTNQFLTQANNSKSKIHKQIQDFFEDYRINSKNLEQYNYPLQLTKANLSISITRYDYTWGLLPSSHDTSKLEGNRDKELDAIISIPIYNAFHRGYSLNSITFICKLTEVITWIETSSNKLSIEKLPTYKQEINLEAKILNLDD